MAAKPSITRNQALDACPVPAVIRERMPLPDGGERIAVEFRSSRTQRWLLRLPETVVREFDLDAFGVEVLEMCDGRRTAGKIAKEFARGHNITLPEAERAVLTFLKMLVGKGVVALAVAEDGGGRKKKPGR